ncbi:RHS repeat-associated core domain-containing protein [Pseudomonas citrulli]|uniref:RHS repeat-associated core domain-containing protein n=1 Tax=Pseudomonas citrulli TaxID=3064347 RepID=A0ABT9C3C7_9PSED|nr:RHS repeat-associated core domain-containing protein [Pseudomonas sp. K18]MDO7897717.1 RHS repeat-associated core domain-containing protein [Pseudomonas sp. K18]
MPIQEQGIHLHTPTLTVCDPRGLTVRSLAYCRSVEQQEAEERVNRSGYNAQGHLVEQWDPRLWALRAEDAAAPANLSNRYSLSGKVLESISVDAGKRISLFGDGDQLVQAWDGRGSARQIEYDDLLRPLTIFEQGEGEVARSTERYEYADGSASFAEHNQCGQLIRHDDPAGTQTLDEYALTGGVLEQTQRFLSALEIPDWPPGLPEREALLEPEVAISSSRFNPLGDVLEQTDARGNRQQFDYTFDGQLFASHLQLSGQPSSQTLVSAIAYNAYSQVERETVGNGVISTLTYRPEDGRLLRLEARRGTEALQDLRYAYDPVGNVLSIEDAALPIRYFANQRIEPIKCFGYDSLYQLNEATGWEAGSANRGPGFNRFDDSGAVANYHQTYRYDAGGNLVELIHVGPQSHSRKLTAARYSNRCLPEHNGRPPTEDEIAAAFDGNGNLLELQPGQAMNWDLRNQLGEVRPVEREGADDDRELYLYGGDGLRRRKIRSIQTNSRSLISQVRYLPGLEIRTHESTGEVLQVICVQAGRSAMQVLHWETTPPLGIANDQYRYNLTDHLGSSSLELDSEAEVISRETYHPFGSTAWFAGRSEVEASYKTVRYSGKERDATGLYYYGFRYYAPWLQRWINPDPAGNVDGLNRYNFLRGGPVGRIDSYGLWGDEDKKLSYFRTNPPQAIHEGQEVSLIEIANNQSATALGLDKFADDARGAVSDTLFQAPLVLQEAQWMQRYLPVLSEPVLRDVFGPEHGQQHSTITNAWARTENLSRQYHNSGFGRGKFVRSEGVDRSTAFVSSADPQGHIFIGDAFMRQAPQERVGTLIHEVSHLSRVRRFSGVGPGTQDFYYVLGSSSSPREYAANIAERGDLRWSNIVDMRRFTAGVEEWGRQAAVGSEDVLWGEELVSMSYHNAYPGLRAYIAARNADSLALAALLLSDVFRQNFHL